MKKKKAEKEADNLLSKDSPKKKVAENKTNNLLSSASSKKKKANKVERKVEYEDDAT